MKIAFFCNEYPPKPHGGIGTFVKTIAEALVRADCDIKVIEFGSVRGHRTENGVQIVTLPQSSVPKFAGLINRLRLWRWITAAGRSKEIDIFELPEYQGWLPFPIFGLGVKIVIRLHQSGTAINKFAGLPVNKFNTAFEFLTLFFHRRWIGVSQYILDLTKTIFSLKPSAAFVVYNPVTVDKAVIEALPKVSPMQEQYVLFVGSISERKGALTLARAVKTLFENGVLLHFVFVGLDTNYNERPISQTILEIVGEANKEWLVFPGRLPHAEALWWMRNALAVVLPSQLEAFSLVPLEAMALGIPVIYTTAASGSEVIENGVTGFLVDPDDSEKLAEHILTLLNNPQLLAQLVKAGRETIQKRFDLQQFVNKSIYLYHKFLKG
jgi:glycosyltransferase involved in cell wall biosynthesis